MSKFDSWVFVQLSGRHAELAALACTLAPAADESPVVGLTGDVGLGKSRLVLDLLEHVEPTTSVLRIEASVPGHEITRGVFGLWTWSIDYAPVPLEGKSFWMPKTIESRAVPNGGGVTWSFVARYRNYHKLEVTSHIVGDPNTLPSAPPQ